MADGMEHMRLTVNEDFAKKLHKQKEKAELDQLKQKFGDKELDNESDSSSSESEDDDARELTSQKEKDFLSVLSMIKNKDPKIYNKDSNFYHEEEKSTSSEEGSNEQEKSKKPMFLKDFERKELLEKGSQAFLSDEESDEDTTNEGRMSPTFVEEQKQIKESFKKAIQDNENEGDFLKEALRHYWMDPSLDKGEQFLRDYILDRNYIEKDSERIPTYDEIVGDDEEDESEFQKQEEFERKFNFRYEEPDAEFIKTYPRTIQGSVRKTDERRKEKRKQRDLKKEKEKEQKREELKRLKNLKRKEIMEKLEKLKEITGNRNVGFKEEDIEGDFDPKKYDEAMQKAFNEEFYEEDENEKPVFEDDLDDENWDEWEGNNENAEEDTQQEQQAEGTLNCEPHSEDAYFNMDADYHQNQNDSNMFGGRKRKGRSRFSHVVAQKKPVFDPDEKTFEDYFDEYYKLDYEDIIGDMPCRFKYRQVVPNDYGLTTEEILSCPDKELNQWVSVKKMSQYRAEREEYQDVKKYRKRGRDQQRKKKILTSLAEAESANEENSKKKKLSGDSLPKKGQKLENTENVVNTNEEALQENDSRTETKNTSNRTINDSEVQNNSQEIPEEQNTPVIKQGQKSQKGKEELEKRKQKQGNSPRTKLVKRQRLTFKELKELAVKKRVQRQFRGAKREQLGNLSAARLASYGLTKKKKKKS
ncbi:KRRI-Interacting protein 1 [Desmophyllum pertusum]|uniref:Protein KRI1 homolog n=1 Tax=Desmophyllum pertusum TaxID=174260 RepID=A0A9W9ZJA3_9CNID|nr:KRRI-Interacting protein 1 [Desmophyllum pertusum]